jgi:glycosyltransferase involved in cell wall biosynthesis
VRRLVLETRQIDNRQLARIPLRIAQVAPLAEAVPPKLYGGTERIVSYLTEELVALGHEVTLYASADSKTSATLRPMCPEGLRLQRNIGDPLAFYHLMVERVAQDAASFDIIHFHIDHMPFSLFRRIDTPSLTTLHGRLDLPELAPLFEEFAEVPVVSISHAQRAPLATANWVGTVHHGLPPVPAPEAQPDAGYLAFLGRFAPEKRCDVAIRLARRAGLRIKVAAKVEPAKQLYFDDVMVPVLAEPHVDFVGEINEDEKPDFLGGARALLFLIDWPEPFGLVMIEAMRCGTPVIAFRRGSVVEVIDDGVTGFIVDSEEEALAAIGRVDMLDRQRIREVFLKRFSARRMAEDYVSLYRARIALPAAKLARRARGGAIVVPSEAWLDPMTRPITRQDSPATGR